MAACLSFFKSILIVSIYYLNNFTFSYLINYLLEIVLLELVRVLHYNLVYLFGQALMLASQVSLKWELGK